MKTLSIIILTWNTGDLTRHHVDTLISKIKNINYEIIVVDNGSTDNTASLFRKDPKVIYLNTGSNLGFSKGNNLGANQASGKYILFLNSDMEYISGLDKMIDYISADPHVGLVGPQFLNPDLTIQGSIFPPQTIVNAFKEFFLHQKTFSKYFLTRTSTVPIISGGAVLISSGLFKQIGGWNEKYYFYYEDLDLCRQISGLGFKIVYFPPCQFIHRHGFSVKQLSGNDTGIKRLIAGSKIFHGLPKHYLLNFIIWTGQKFTKYFSNLHHFFSTK